jgi:phosphatidylethanolamine-binding protein (PEBP) family uncharacterized protein
MGFGLGPRIGEAMPKTRYRNQTRKICKGSKVGLWRSRKKRGAGNEFQVRYGIQRVADQRFTRADVVEIPKVLFDIQDNKQYTFVLYDPDSPSPAYLHWLITNITKYNRNTILSYQSPEPPTTDTHYHTYMFELLEQPGPISVRPIGRESFSIDALKKTYGLKTIASCGFYIDPQL